MHLPRVSIVTPTRNTPRFLAETIESVLGQDYPDVEYIVMDGGDDTETPGIVARYPGRVRHIRQADTGVADAVNRGVSLASGHVIGWLSADDTYRPGAVAAAVEALSAQPDAAVAWGLAHWIDESGSDLGPYPTREPQSNRGLDLDCCLCQPSCFIRREAFDSVGGLNTDVNSAFDYDLWIRLSKKYRFVHVPQVLANSRMHRTNKSLADRETMFRESMDLLQQHFGYVPVQWIYGYESFRLDRRDQFFDPLRRSPAAFLRSLITGSTRNHGHLLRYWGEWARTLARGLRG